MIHGKQYHELKELSANTLYVAQEGAMTANIVLPVTPNKQNWQGKHNRPDQYRLNARGRRV